MTKYNLEVKKKFIELMKTNKYSISLAASELGMSTSVAKRWWIMYQIHGDKGLTMKSEKYAGEFKVHVVKYMHENHLSISEASAVFEIPSSSTLLNWKRIYYEKGEMGLLDQRIGRSQKEDMKKDEPKIEDNCLDTEAKANLIKEVEKLRAEVAYLKKSIALKEEKRSLQIKKKQW